jgi:hypothetical protein
MQLLWKSGCLAGVAALTLMAQPPGPPPHGGGWFGPGSRIMPFGSGMAATVTGAPYSAVETTEMVQQLADGNTIVERQQTNLYRDAQGRVRIEHTMPARPGSSDQAARKTVSIFDPVAGSTYMLQPAEMKAYKSGMRPRPPADAGAQQARPLRHAEGGASARQVQTENLGLQTINGLAATGTRTTQTIPTGAIGNTQPIQIVREVWMSQDLKIPVMIKTTDPRFGNTVMQLTNVQTTNPDPALFQVPAGYTVQSSPGRMPGGHMRPPANGTAPIR